ncbi:hypothetical protein [Paenibacillus sp. FSL F4-0236]|uniref:hypothetical protein n=1 Tax=Paenibacillus sp. FSL F4-0236 TaxID=2954731 RepID=UPI004047A9C9
MTLNKSFPFVLFRWLLTSALNLLEELELSIDAFTFLGLTVVIDHFSFLCLQYVIDHPADRTGFERSNFVIAVSKHTAVTIGFAG